MGKSMREKSKKQRVQVTGIPFTSVPKDDFILNAEENSVHFVLNKLQSCSAEDKECGAGIVARMSNNLQFVTEFMRCRGIKILGPILADSNSAVRNTVCGSLRNLSICSIPNICNQMVEQDVMTPLSNLISEYTEKWIPARNCGEKIDSKKATFLEACYLLTYLCEGSDVAIDAFNRHNLVFTLLPCMNLQNFGLDITSAVAHCLLTITEDNKDVIMKMSPFQNDVMALLQLSSKDTSHVYLKILSAGIILNLYSGSISKCSSSTRKDILCVLEEALELSVEQDMANLSQMLCCQMESSKNKYSDQMEVDKKRTIIDDKYIALQEVLTLKKVALEILANIFTSNDAEEDESWSDAESSSDNEDITDSEDLVSSIMHLGLDLSCDVSEMIIEKDMIHKILNQIVIPHTDIVKLFQDTSEGMKFLEKLHVVRCRALFCINNLVVAFKIEELCEKEELFKIWMDLSVLAFSQTDLCDLEQVQAASSSVRAVLQKLAETDVANHFAKITLNDLKLFFDIWKKCIDLPVRANIVRSLATIACILNNLKEMNSLIIIKEIGLFLMDACVNSTELWIIAEALDAIMDVFAEDHLSELVTEIDLIPKLKLLLPTFKGKIKQQRNSLGDNYPLVMTAKINLVRFLKYKKNQSTGG